MLGKQYPGWNRIYISQLFTISRLTIIMLNVFINIIFKLYTGCGAMETQFSNDQCPNSPCVLHNNLSRPRYLQYTMTMCILFNTHIRRICITIKGLSLCRFVIWFWWIVSSQLSINNNVRRIKPYIYYKIKHSIYVIL